MGNINYNSIPKRGCLDKLTGFGAGLGALIRLMKT
jgi:hypothetical protein